ncbi:MAG: hypothetical protein E7660_02430 [Ruminococcaceae bacterium]|nr:hypothetical protein [Oscillospiraceae bacterium]
MDMFEKFNTLVGEVIGCNRHGCYVLDDETDKVVFYYGCGKKGDRVQLTIKKVDLEKELVTCMLDSVLSYVA